MSVHAGKSHRPVCADLTFVFQKMLQQGLETMMQDDIEQELDGDIRAVVVGSMNVPK
jgi:hypothetical protein